jgi:hypothetical protein
MVFHKMNEDYVTLLVIDLLKGKCVWFISRSQTKNSRLILTSITTEGNLKGRVVWQTTTVHPNNQTEITPSEEAVLLVPVGTLQSHLVTV